MRIFSKSAYVFVLVFLLQIPIATAAEKTELLFIQMSKTMAFDGRKITLSGAGPHVVWFTERPQRKSGHMSLEEFLSSWDKGSDNFDTDPPNAVLTLLDASDGPAVLKISNPVLSTDGLTYDVEIIEGSIPKSGGPVSLVIDGKVIGIDLG